MSEFITQKCNCKITGKLLPFIVVGIPVCKNPAGSNLFPRIDFYYIRKELYFVFLLPFLEINLSYQQSKYLFLCSMFTLAFNSL